MVLKFVIPCKDTLSFKSTVLQENALVLCVVDVYCEWCGPCDALDSKLHQIYMDMAEYAHVKVIGGPIITHVKP